MTTLPLMTSELLYAVAMPKGRGLVQIETEPKPLIPTRPLEAGEQYRFHFDMTQCIGCKCCVVACNEQNGNPAALNWRRVGEVEGGHYPLTVKGGVKPDHWGGEKVDHSTGWRCLSLKELRGWLERRPATRVAGRVLGRSGSRPRNLAPRVEGGDYERGLAGRFCLLSLSR